MRRFDRIMRPAGCRRQGGLRTSEWMESRSERSANHWRNERGQAETADWVFFRDVGCRARLSGRRGFAMQGAASTANTGKSQRSIVYGCNPSPKLAGLSEVSRAQNAPKQSHRQVPFPATASSSTLTLPSSHPSSRYCRCLKIATGATHRHVHEVAGLDLDR